jgi:hypothetical protein
MIETPNCGAVVLETNTYEKPNSVQPALTKGEGGEHYE